MSTIPANKYCYIPNCGRLATVACFCGPCHRRMVELNKKETVKP